MTTYSSRWAEPTKGNCAMVALDTRYQWMLPVCALCLRSTVDADIEAWTWGRHSYDPEVVAACHQLGVSLKRLPDTGQYCEGWEARHHAMCVTEYRRVFMLDVDTYVLADLPWLFQPMNAGLRLRAGELWENYTRPSFARFFGLEPREGGYTNYSVWFGEYDRAHQGCREVLCRTSDLLGSGAGVYGAAAVVGDQDIRNGVLHKVGCPIELIEVKANAWETLEVQLQAGNSIVHQTEKALTKDAAAALTYALLPSLSAVSKNKRAR
jgi:hypothetical protein